jgi:hypothetical protein
MPQWGKCMSAARGFGGISRMRMAGAACVLTLAALTTATATAMAAPSIEVGTTVLTKKKVTGIIDLEERDLKKGFRVFRNELVRTGPESQAELRLDDNTKLALGPDAELRLDEFAVSGGSDAKSIAVRLLKGTLRFLTGRNSSEVYKIETPSATIGVRGTVFDLYIGPNGDTFVLLHQGEVEICSRTNACRPHRQVGRVVRASVLGVVSDPVKWTAKLVGGGVSAAKAFPFVGRRLVIDPVRRLTHRAISDDVRILERGGKEIERTIRKISPF